MIASAEIPSKLAPQLRQVITSKQAWFYKIIPKSAVNGHIEFFIANEKLTPQLQKELSIILGKSINLHGVEESALSKALSIHYGDGGKKETSYFNEEGKFLENIILEASNLRSSDIHIEKFEDSGKIRFRVNGKMIERFHIKSDIYPKLINRIKVSASLDIAERRLPQDGRIQFNEKNEAFDIRVSILPTLHGEKAVLRLLKRDADHLDLNKLGFESKQLFQYRQAFNKPNGIILVSGPTGSGKTTTLYSTLKELNKEEVNIVTVEDPIEYTLQGINQVQTKDKIGLTFASALRSFLRQDPDIIMLGEIRDQETANMAIRAALTGHLVLSTIHTNSSWGTITRLIDMGVPNFLLASTLNVSIAQRLVRTLCNHCKKEVETLDERHRGLLKGLNINLNMKISEPVGCNKCLHTGYSGRKAIYEVLPLSDELRELVMKNQFNAKEYFISNKINTLKDQAFQLLLNQETSLEEAYPLLIE